ncbi:MAG: hypothetical protein WKF82_13835 [Nocardioidaceae bacterium]
MPSTALCGVAPSASAAASGPGDRRCTTWRRDSIPTPTTRSPHATYREMALAGITAVGEFHYLHHDSDGQPYSDPNAMGAGR